MNHLRLVPVLAVPGLTVLGFTARRVADARCTRRSPSGPRLAHVRLLAAVLAPAGEAGGPALARPHPRGSPPGAGRPRPRPPGRPTRRGAGHRAPGRTAVQEADAQPSGSTITILVPAGTFPLKLGVLSLTANTITVQGTGASTVDGRNASQVFNIGPAASVTLGQLAIIDGNASLGGGIQNAGTLTVTHSTVTTSVASHAGG